MSVTTVLFLLFLIAGTLVYYVTPGKFKWVSLLVLSGIFYYYAAVPESFLFLVASALIAYLAGIAMDNLRSNGEQDAKRRKLIGRIGVIAILLDALLWFLIKGTDFWLGFVHLLGRIFPSLANTGVLPIAAALGMGYYTAQTIGYILDCSWEIQKPEKNFFKVLLFTCFFPQLTVGPISSYKQFGEVFEPHKFSYRNYAFGWQRILWGLFKKLVISDRVGIMVNAIWERPDTWNGVWLWVAVLLYPLQIYTDFSGCMDIVLGAAELFGIHLPENFRNPFYSLNCQEFWQRWHITLGVWARDHVYYPVQKSRPIVAIGKWSKKHFAKRTARLIPWSIGMAVLWFVMGFWHGSSRHIVGVSLYFWVILVLSEVLTPAFDRLKKLFAIDTEAFGWKLFQRVRTYLIYSVGVVFFSAPSLAEAWQHMLLLAKSIRTSNFYALANGSVWGLGVTALDLNVIVIGVLLLFVVDHLREYHEYARLWMEKQILPLRWLVWFALIFMVVIYGMYGPGYDAAEFIYQGF